MAHTHPVIDGDNHFIIDPITRAVTNAESKKTILMQNDHNSERFTFEIDKLVEGHDMTKCNKVEVHYTNEDSNKKNKNVGVYEVADMQESADNPDKLAFSWLVSENATLYAGSLKFLVVFSCVEKGDVTYRWNTNINTSISIAKGMNNGEAIEEAYPDVLTQWKQQLFAAVYGMETTYVGPNEPETYPYIWFDTSQYVGSSEPYIGVITIKDSDGNKHVLYPFAKLAGTDGADLEKKFDQYISVINEINKTLPTKIDKTRIVNNLTTTEEGYVLDARQGKELKDDIDGKIDTLTNDKIDKTSIVNNLTTTEEGYVLDARQGVALEALIRAITPAGIGAVTMKTAIASLTADGWSDNSQTVSAPGVTENNVIIPSADPDSYDHYNECGVRCVSQSNGTVTFGCIDVPTSALTVYVLILE